MRDLNAMILHLLHLATATIGVQEQDLQGSHSVNHTGPMLNIPGVGLTSRALALHQSKATDDTHRSQMEEDQRKL